MPLANIKNPYIGSPSDEIEPHTPHQIRATKFRIEEPSGCYLCFLKDHCNKHDKLLYFTAFSLFCQIIPYCLQLYPSTSHALHVSIIPVYYLMLYLSTVPYLYYAQVFQVLEASLT